MGCCNTVVLETEGLITLHSNARGEDDEDFNDLPLSSGASPLKFKLAQEDFRNSATRVSYETTTLSYGKFNMEMAFVGSKL